MKELSEQLQHAIATKSRFLANMSHEVRTPLSGIIGMSRILMETGNLTIDQCECVATIQHCGETLLAVINDVLDYTKLEAIGKEMTLENNELSLHQCIEESLYTVLPAAQKKNLELIIEIDPQIPDRILGDMLRLRQVVVNLLNNAVKFTDKGFIHVVVTGTEIQGTDEWKFCCKIRDTGCGIPLESKGKLFKMFSQVDVSTTRKYGGTGIGLALAKRFLEMMNGEIWMESSGVPGEGSTFSFSLNATLAPFASASSPSAMTSPHALANSTSIFIIKSVNPLSSEVLCRRLMGKGLFNTQITATSNIDQSFKEIQDFVYGLGDKNVLIFCDVEQVTPWHKYALLEYPNLVMILMGYTPKNLDTDGYPPHEFLRKPVKQTSLVRLLREAWTRFDTKHIPSTTRSPRKQASPQQHHNPLKILIVEDNEMNQKVACRVFQHLGYTNIPIANHGQEALEMIEKNGVPDLILMDLQMPVLDGVQTTKIIRQKYPSWPFIVSMTADAFPEDKKNCLDAGMNDFLTKPIRVEQVHNTIQKCLKIKAKRSLS